MELSGDLSDFEMVNSRWGQRAVTTVRVLRPEKFKVVALLLVGFFGGHIEKKMGKGTQTKSAAIRSDVR